MKNRTAEIIYNQMLCTTSREVSQAALKIMDRLQDDKVCNQVLGLATALICMLNEYELNHIDVLGIAHNIVFSGANNNILPDFKVIKKYMKTEWEM